MSDERKGLSGCEYGKTKSRKEVPIKRYTFTETSFVQVEPKSSPTEAAVSVADGLIPIENENDKQNVTERLSPAIEMTSEKLDAAEN
jgi:hypothetical protein